MFESCPFIVLSCLSLLVKNHLKQGNIQGNLKCPSCSRVLWVRQNENDIQLDSPVALQLYKIFEAEWWGKSLISNEPIDAGELEKFLLEDTKQESTITIQETSLSSNVQPLSEIIQSNGTPHHYYYQEPQSSIESTNNIVKQAVHHRYNNVIPNQPEEQEQQQLQSSQFIGQATNKQLYKTYKSPLLSNNDDDYPSDKYYRKPKKFENQLLNFINGIWNSQYKVYIFIVAIIVVILFVVLVSHSSDDSSIDNIVDYGGDGDSNNNEAILDKL
ncbi:uncharacterized protein LOC126899981 isoform X2 [Daktulosphaira vitifoliae]|uniref:uncharacterized protein LOC126899981 isoform X2 n=1 Tax=Daktulosphaira vitifoliae TaxID=58002 RepID=UPI0021A9C9BA|nr:uncharacterized protein LOC126899981 isoform X2 [Daktulosphaira vitifoliae]